jgi:hypothetical protein
VPETLSVHPAVPDSDKQGRPNANWAALGTGMEKPFSLTEKG